ncbi:hypothetical protein KCTCHS21_51400 [Cohnella abietis]|uniref:Uncharacterized protein n=1 Tax=Cohnella abietis TaxID=2507935 RepID=A0A3T1DC63_9BACL|nr:hypothetical protein KCTCHS21_51400 [Cohnella abietis]
MQVGVEGWGKFAMGAGWGLGGCFAMGGGGVCDFFYYSFSGDLYCELSIIKL